MLQSLAHCHTLRISVEKTDTMLTHQHNKQLYSHHSTLQPTMGIWFGNLTSMYMYFKVISHAVAEIQQEPHPAYAKLLFMQIQFLTLLHVVLYTYILSVLYLLLWVPDAFSVHSFSYLVALLATHSVEIAWNALKKLHDSLKQHCLRWIVHSVCIAMPPYTNWVYLIFCKSCGHRTKTSRERDPGPKI